MRDSVEEMVTDFERSQKEIMERQIGGMKEFLGIQIEGMHAMVQQQGVCVSVRPPIGVIASTPCHVIAYRARALVVAQMTQQFAKEKRQLEE